MLIYEHSDHDQSRAIAGAAALLLLDRFVAQNDPPVDSDHARLQDAMQAIRPRPDDYARVFRGEAIEAAREAYEPVWKANPSFPLVPHGAIPDIWVAAGGAFAADVRYWRQFPGGMGNIAKWLQIDRIWVGWRFRVPSGSDYRSEGLVWLDGRFVMFPKVWDVLEKLG